jgi:tetratricopeptide (TPR) repeat protein
MAELSLCMIVRDESKVLARCLESIAGVADETVIMDTGSTDGTVEIARSFGAWVEPFAWIDDFSAARNRSFELASCPYILWLDADDVLLPAERDKLLALKRRLDKDAYLLRYDYVHDRFGACTSSFLRERIVRNTPRFRWCLPVHESISLGPDVASEAVDITVTHRPAGNMQRKHEKYLGLLERLARQLGGSCPWVDCLLGSEYHAGSRYAEAAAAYERFLEHSDERSIDGSCVRRQLAESRYGLALQARDPAEKRLHRQRARAAAESAWRLDPRRSEPLLLLGHIAEEEGELAEAVSWYERAIQPLPAVAAPVSPVAYGVAPAIRLSEVWKRLGDLPRARHYNEMALAWRPTDPLLHLARRALGT